MLYTLFVAFIVTALLGAALYLYSAFNHNPVTGWSSVGILVIAFAILISFYSIAEQSAQTEQYEPSNAKISTSHQMPLKGE